jgi:two-component system, NarL family, response regulator NreC
MQMPAPLLEHRQFVSGWPMNKVLTSREREILIMLAEGKSNSDISVQLGISVRTVEGHRHRLMLKLDCQNFVELVKYAVQNKLVDW